MIFLIAQYRPYPAPHSISILRLNISSLLTTYPKIYNLVLMTMNIVFIINVIPMYWLKRSPSRPIWLKENQNKRYVPGKILRINAQRSHATWSLKCLSCCLTGLPNNKLQPGLIIFFRAFLKIICYLFIHDNSSFKCSPIILKLKENS